MPSDDYSHLWQLRGVFSWMTMLVFGSKSVKTIRKLPTKRKFIAGVSLCMYTHTLILTGAKDLMYCADNLLVWSMWGDWSTNKDIHVQYKRFLTKTKPNNLKWSTEQITYEKATLTNHLTWSSYHETKTYLEVTEQAYCLHQQEHNESAHLLSPGSETTSVECL